MIGWYMELHWAFRLGLALLILGVGAARYFLEGVFWVWPWAIGGLMLCLSLPNRDDRSKYNF